MCGCVLGHGKSSGPVLGVKTIKCKKGEMSDWIREVEGTEGKYRGFLSKVCSLRASLIQKRSIHIQN